MFELADRLVGIYKTDNCTKSITINPGSFAESMKVVQCTQLRVLLLNVTTLVSFARLITTLNVTLVVSSWNRGSSGIVVCRALCKAVCYVKQLAKAVCSTISFLKLLFSHLIEVQLDTLVFHLEADRHMRWSPGLDMSCFASKPRYNALRALLMLRPGQFAYQLI